MKTTHKDDYIVSAKREVYPPAIIIIHSTNVETCCLLSKLDYRNKISADPKKYETDIPEAELSKYNPDRMREGDRVCGFGGLCFCVICWFRLP